MITINGHHFESTKFPDKTSQVWKLPDRILEQKIIQIVWRFSEEREIIDLYSLRYLLREDAQIHLHIPYLPYARQDKLVSNNATFNLCVFAELINALKCSEVTAVDVHNPSLTGEFIRNFRNESVKQIHEDLITRLRAEYVVYPDYGAYKRYKCYYPCISVVFKKARNQETGEIIGHAVDYAITSKEFDPTNTEKYKPNCKFLIIDDICDGGATFLSVAKALNSTYAGSHSISLFTTHGLYSKGKEVLEKAGIQLFTTNSLPHNTDGYQV